MASLPSESSDPTRRSVAGRDLWAWRQRACESAQAHGIDDAEVDWLLQQIYPVDRLALRLGTLATQGEVPAKLSLAELEQRWQRRLQDRVPIQYLVGQTPWRDFTLRVSPAVLIPRPETELIIDYLVAAVDLSPHAEVLRRGVWADLGTGSGAIAIGLAAVFPEALIVAIDISPEALKVAQANVALNGFSDRILLRQGTWFEPLERLAMAGQLVGVVANPPYIPSAMLPTLQPEVAHHEPAIALDGGEDGLASLRHLVTHAPQFLQSGGLWAVELMAGQAPAVATALAQNGHYDPIQTQRDLAGIDRFVLAQRR
ncbi:peptide chain release factor N(5)-glutamine methyltransferase [Leptolyngbya sp. PCC 6406]|uniref:peptide chain release factor N(5)-glutamine methyltransferase n=1 Tax=Leptolyngbya sp. PCC 6406 TaxID=1173264 RepID=UPI0002ACA513|nr:peptide chain release factor N(5)-glutamine methyltransferase [Leptolyngbya sp. PCC 6406]